MDSEFGFLAKDNHIHFGRTRDGTTEQFSVRASSKETWLFNELAAHQVNTENCTPLLDSFLGIVSNSGDDWNITVEEDSFVLNDEVALNPALGMFLGYVPDNAHVGERHLPDWLSESKKMAWIDMDYEKSVDDFEGIESSQKLEYSGFGVKQKQNGQYPVLELEGSSDMYPIEVHSDIMHEQFLEERRRDLSEGNYHQEFYPDPASIGHKESLGRDVVPQDLSWSDVYSTLVYFMQEGESQPEIGLDVGETNSVQSVISYDDEVIRGPYEIAYSSTPSYTNSLQVSEDVLEILDGIAGEQPDHDSREARIGFQ